MRKTASQILRNLEMRVAKLERKSSKVRLTKNFYAILKKEYKLAMSLSELCNDDCKELIQIVAGFNIGAVQKGTHKYSRNDTVQKIVRINQSDKQRAGRILAQACLLCTKSKNHERLILKMLKSGGRLPTTLYRRDFDSAFKAVFPSFTSLDELLEVGISDGISLEFDGGDGEPYRHTNEIEWTGSGSFGVHDIEGDYYDMNDEILSEIYDIFKSIMTPVIIKEVKDLKEAIEDELFETEDFKSFKSFPLEDARFAIYEWDWFELFDPNEQQAINIEFKFAFSNSLLE